MGLVWDPKSQGSGSDVLEVNLPGKGLTFFQSVNDLYSYLTSGAGAINPLGQPPGSPSGGSSGGSGGGSGGSGTFLTDIYGNKISQSSYDSLAADIRFRAAKYGDKPTDQEIHNLIYNGVSGDIFEERLQVQDWANKNENNKAGFEYALRQEGLAKKFNNEDFMKFAAGLAPKAWYDLWNKAAVAGGVLSSGATLGETDQGGVEFSKGNVKHFEGLLPGGETGGFGIASQDQQAIAQVVGMAIKALPAGRYGGFSYATDIDKLGDAVIAGDQEAMAKAQQILANESAKYKGPKVGSSLVQQQGGRTTLLGLGRNDQGP